MGPRFSGGHGVRLSNDEFRRISARDASLTFCPCSNLFLGSGLFRLGRVTDPAFRIRLSFGTDMGGGNRFSMLSVLDEAYKVGMYNNTLLDGSVDPSREDLAEAERNKLSPYRGFWSPWAALRGASSHHEQQRRVWRVGPGPGERSGPRPHVGVEEQSPGAVGASTWRGNRFSTRRAPRPGCCCSSATWSARRCWFVPRSSR